MLISSRRQFVKLGAAAAVCVTLPQMAWATTPVRTLSLLNLHTGEKLGLSYYEKGQYVPSAMRALNHFLRDYRTGDIHPIAPALFDQLYTLQQMVDTPGAYHVISGYRSQRTNQMLHAHSDGVAKSSLHMQGRAIDIFLPGKELSHLQKAALAMGAGGVGYYPQSGFIHLDVGPTRHWG